MLHLLKPLFSVYYVFQALSIFVLVNDLYIGDPLEANKTQEICYSSKTLLMNTLSSGRINPLPSSMYRSYNRIPQSKGMHIMPRGHIVTDPSTFSYFVTLSLERSTFDLDSSSVVRSLICLFLFLKAILYPKCINIAHAMVKFRK